MIIGIYHAYKLLSENKPITIRNENGISIPIKNLRELFEFGEVREKEKSLDKTT
jgi:hypothetical protein